MKGIVLAGGSGTRLHPATKVINKHLLPVYDKPMIYYPISTLKNAGITEILVITDMISNPWFERLLGDGSEFGLDITYEIQLKPSGIAEALIIGEEFIGGDAVTLILGDNIFYSQYIDKELRECLKDSAMGDVACIFGYHVSDPSRYGVIVEDQDTGKPLRIIEKPTEWMGDHAVVGLYCYPNNVIQKAKNLKPSKRGELEITDINNLYFDDGRMMVNYLPKDTTWLDTGTHDSLIEASMFVKTIKDRNNVSIGEL